MKTQRKQFYIDGEVVKNPRVYYYKCDDGGIYINDYKLEGGKRIFSRKHLARITKGKEVSWNYEAEKFIYFKNWIEGVK